MKPLAGVRILDCSRIVAAPYATQLLGQLGATVWKVESLAGDDTRQWGPPYDKDGVSSYFKSINRAKKSIAVNFKHPDGAQLIRELATHADVFVENFKTGTLASYGLDQKSLAAVNPSLIYCSLTAFGQTGPRAKQAGYDLALQALCGVIAMSGSPDDKGPSKVPVAWVDVIAGLHAAVAILAQLRLKAVTDAPFAPPHLDVSLHDCALHSLINQAAATLATGNDPARLGSAHPSIAPYQALQAADGAMAVAVGNDSQFGALIDVLSCSDALKAAGLHWAAPPRKAKAAAGAQPDAADAAPCPHGYRDIRTNAGRVHHRAALVAVLEKATRQRDVEELVETLTQRGVPAVPVLGLRAALDEAHASGRGAIEFDAVAGSAGPGAPAAQSGGEADAAGACGRDGAYVATPLRFAGASNGEAPPREAGGSTRSILREVLGLGTHEVDRLLAAGAIRAAE